MNSIMKVLIEAGRKEDIEKLIKDLYNDIKQEQSYCVGSFVPNMTGKQIRP